MNNAYFLKKLNSWWLISPPPQQTLSIFDVFTQGVYQTFLKDILVILYKLLHKIVRGKAS